MNVKIKLAICVLSMIMIACEQKQDFIAQKIEMKSIKYLNDCQVLIENADHKDTHLVINALQDLQKYVLFEGPIGDTCEELKDDLNIDFSKYTLLIGKARLTAIQGSLIDQSIEKGADGKYNYNVEIMNGGYTAIGQFRFGAVVSKIPDGTKVQFNVVVKEYKE